MRSRYGLITAGLIATVAVAVMVGGAAARPTAAGGDVIAYQGDGKIWVINADGSGRRALISGVTSDGELAWSPDGKQIAFTVIDTSGDTAYQDQHEIYLASSDGKNVRLLTGKSLDVGEPTWSPDGTRIAFMNFTNKRHNIYVIGVDGKNLQPVARPPHGGGQYEAPDWSPDGNWILFERYRYTGGYSTLFEIHPDGTGLRKIATFYTAKACICGDWSPDGSKIAVQASPDTNPASRPEIYVINADGTGRIRLTTNTFRDENPDWSPDGTRIAYYSEAKGNGEIYVVGADGGDVTRVTHDPWYSAFPRWKPSA